MRRFLFAGFGLLVACGHDAGRDNPVDPELTPAVGLVAALDDTSGAVTLAWGEYSGRSRFAAYLVLRNESERTVVDTLATVGNLEQTSFVDSTIAPNTAYEYRVAVRTEAGLDVPSNLERVEGYVVGAVQLLEPEADAQRAEIRLRWHRYSGARFEAYRVERRLVGEDEFSVVDSFVTTSDTLFVDTDVILDARYVYQVVLEAAGRDWGSNRTGREGLTTREILPLGATADPGAGVIRLSWNRYLGAGFEQYRLTRAGTDEDAVPVFTSSSNADTAFVDSTALSGVDYRYTLSVQTDVRELAGEPVTRRVTLSPVALRTVATTPDSALARLSWSRYGGPRFAAYRIERRTTTLASQTVARFTDITQTSFKDTGLTGNTEQFYRVVVETTLGDDLPSSERSVIIYRWVAEWELDIAEGEHIRLYDEPDGQTAAVLADESRARVLIFDSAGQVVTDWIAWQRNGETLRPTSAAMGLLPDGSRVLSLRLRFPGAVADMTVLLHFDASRRMLQYDRNMLADSLLTAAEGVEVEGTGSVTTVGGGIEAVTVYSEGEVVLTDEFDSDTSTWDSETGQRVDSALKPLSRVARVEIRDRPWADLSFDVDFAPTDESTTQTVLVGGGNVTHLMSQVSSTQGALIVRWRLPGGVTQRDTVAAYVPDGGLTLHSGFDQGRPLSNLLQPPLVERSDAFGSDVSLAVADDWVVLIDGAQPYVLIPGSMDSGEQEPFPGQVKDVRVWRGRRNLPWIGMCHPDLHTIRIRRIAFDDSGIVGLRTFFLFSEEIGGLPGRQPGQFVFPLSLDGSPDGPIFVLDAGNTRIQAFHRSGDFLTQWGTEGSGPGQFDFGSSLEPYSLAGSVTVDDNGRIYVADVGNRRIQVFEP